MTIFILFIPFIVVISFDIDNKKEIQLKYVYNKIIRDLFQIGVSCKPQTVLS